MTRMCGRFVSVASPELLVERFGLEGLVDGTGPGDGTSRGSGELPDLGARYNVAPRAQIYGVTAAEGTRALETLRWGLVPFWAKELKIGDRMINARAETVAEKPAYRNAFRKHRCLLPVTAFYEWERVPDKPKQPWLFSPADGEPLAFAGLSETWRDPADDDAEPVRSAAIVTTTANDVMAPVHDRMPVILPESAWGEWLDPDNRDTGSLQELLVPADDDVLDKWPVSTRVNNARNQGADLVERVSLPGGDDS